MGLRWQEILMILVVLLLLFGATRLPQLGASLGSAIRNFKKSFSTEEPGGEKKKDTASLSSSGTTTEQVKEEVKAKDA